MSNELRVAGNNISIAGVVKEIKGFGKEPMKIEEKTKDGEKWNEINGSIVVRTNNGDGNNNDIELRVSFLKEFTKSGNVNKKFALLKDVINGKIKTLATAKQGEEALRISIWGNGDFVPKIGENRIPDIEENKVKCRPQFEIGFGNITEKTEEELPEDKFKAEFEIEAYIDKIEEEVKKNEDNEEEETGRLVIKAYMPLYGGDIMPLELIVPEKLDDEPFAKEILDAVDRGEIEEGMTMYFNGIIKNEAIEDKSKKKGIGKVKTKKVKYINELVIEGVDWLPSNKQYDEEDIESALKERQIKLEEKLQKANDKSEKSTTKTRGLGEKPKSNGEEGTARKKFNF